MQAVEWCHFRWPRLTPDPGFKDTVVLKGEYFQSDAFYRHLVYRTLIGNHTQAIDRKASYTAYNTLLLHKLCKRFASIARVCQRQLAFLVIVSNSFWRRSFLAFTFHIFCRYCFAYCSEFIVVNDSTYWVAVLWLMKYMKYTLPSLPTLHITVNILAEPSTHTN